MAQGDGRWPTLAQTLRAHRPDGMHSLWEEVIHLSLSDRPAIPLGSHGTKWFHPVGHDAAPRTSAWGLWFCFQGDGAKEPLLARKSGLWAAESAQQLRGPGKLFPHLSSTCRTIKAVVSSTMKLSSRHSCSSQNRVLSPHRCRAHCHSSGFSGSTWCGGDISVSPLATR